jgi:hypothetical protein
VNGLRPSFEFVIQVRIDATSWRMEDRAAAEPAVGQLDEVDSRAVGRREVEAERGWRSRQRWMAGCCGWRCFDDDVDGKVGGGRGGR